MVGRAVYRYWTLNYEFLLIGVIQFAPALRPDQYQRLYLID